jgi:hypothetical protein
MTGEPCLKPGWARRSEGYEASRRACAVDDPIPDLNRLMIDKALALGTAGELTPSERCLMAALLAHLDISGTSAGQTCVWPGAARLRTLLDLGDSTLRRLKAGLEEKGFIMRRYDRRNRPLPEGAIDLKPFLLRVPNILAEMGHTEAVLRSYRSDAAKEWCEEPPKESARAPADERPTRNPPSHTPVRHVGEDKPGVDPASEDLRLAGRLHRPLAALPSHTEEREAAIAATAETILGRSRGRKLFAWAQRRHGDTAVLALAIAAENPKLRDRAGWFGWFATSADTPDLAGNAEALLAASKTRTTREPLPQPEPPDERFRGFFDIFEGLTDRGVVSSYLAGSKLQGEPCGPLTIHLATRTAEERLRQRHWKALGLAATEAGFTEVTLAGPKRE